MRRVYRILYCNFSPHVPQFPDCTVCGGGDSDELFFREFRTPELMKRWLAGLLGADRALWATWQPIAA
jgi:hypothetical protein